MIDHPGLAWLRDVEDGRAWLGRLPGLIDECREQWALREVGEPFAYALASLALPVVCADGSDAVLKVQYPHPEALHEADALRAWDGAGAVRLLAHDVDRWALLLERAMPGSSLAGVPLDKALDVACDLLPRLWVKPGGQFTPLAQEAAGWVTEIETGFEAAGRPFDRRLVDAAAAAVAELGPSQPDEVLLHQDLHADNILRAQREPWLAIDPKPLRGERAFGIAPLVRGDELGGSKADVLRRFDRLTADLGVDRARARGWTLVQTLAWALDDGEADARMVQVAEWIAALDA